MPSGRTVPTGTIDPVIFVMKSVKLVPSVREVTLMSEAFLLKSVMPRLPASNCRNWAVVSLL